MIKKFSILFIVVDIILIIISIAFFNTNFLLNTQVAFIASAFITIASFLGYKNSISKKLQDVDRDKLSETDRDKIDEIDDPYDLYSPEITEEFANKDLSASEIKEIIKEEKQRIKKNSFKNMFNNGGGFISIYRIVGYVLLILSFFILNNHGIFNPIGFLLGLSVVPIGAVFSNFVLKKDS